MYTYDEMFAWVCKPVFNEQLMCVYAWYNAFLMMEYINNNNA